MAKKQSLTRVSPGVYRDEAGRLVKSGSGILQEPPKQQKKVQKPSPQPGEPAQPPPLPQFEGAGLQPVENQVVQQQFERDIAAGQQAQQMQPTAYQGFNQPFDWTKGPQAPEVKNVEDFAQQASQKYMDAFEQKMGKAFKEQQDDFEQQMYNRGIPVGSPLYNQQKAQLAQQQQDARTQAFASGQAQAMANAGQLFGIGQQARSSYLGEQMAQRNLPFDEYLKVSGSISPFGAQAYGGSQNLQGQREQFANQRWLLKNTPRGGGGGGGGTPPFMGFGSAQALWEAQDARNMANLERELQIRQQYQPKQPYQPSSWETAGAYGLATLGGGLLGKAGEYLGKLF